MGDVVVEVAWMVYGPRGRLVASGAGPAAADAWDAALAELARVVDPGSASDGDVALAVRRPEGPASVRFESGYRVVLA